MPRAASAFRAALSLVLALLAMASLSSPASAARLAAGDGHTCAINPIGTVQCWGRGADGQLGDGTQKSAPVAPVKVSGLSDATAITAGSDHTCAMRGTGSVVCWGAGDEGQLGDGADADALSPVAVTGLTDATAISAGGEHTCAVRATGAVVCWGDDSRGQLGDAGGSTGHASTPVTVDGLSGASGVSAGGRHTCAVATGGVVECWGAGDEGQLGNGDTADHTAPVTVAGLPAASAVTTGPMHSCALLTSGAAQCWGSNAGGELGNGTMDASATPVSVSGLAAATALDASTGTLNPLYPVAHTCARLGDGTARCWGAGYFGELGDGSGTMSSTPVVVSGLAGVTAIAAGTVHSCALPASGTPVCWGRGDEGQLGNGRSSIATSPVAVAALTDATAVSTGWANGCVVRTGGTLSCWGATNNTSTDTASEGDLPAEPTPVAGLSGVAGVSSSADHTCIVRDDGTAACWGDGFYGQLGSATDRTQTPVDVTGLTNATAIATGYSDQGDGGAFSCALRSTGAVACWGAGGSGELGNNATDNSDTPVAVSGLSTATAIALGDAHACALRADGRVLCWGVGDAGRLGNGSTLDRSTPVLVSGLTDATAIAAGGAHTCARRTGGTVVCWGNGDDGQLGRGSDVDSSVPVPVNGLTSIAGLATGEFHTCAFTTAGAVSCWGSNTSGQLGTGDQASSQAPKSVAGATGVTALAAGLGHTCARRSTGAVVCWGEGRNGQLGDGYIPTGHRAVQLVAAAVTGFDTTPAPVPTTPPAGTTPPAETGPPPVVNPPVVNPPAVTPPANSTVSTPATETPSGVAPPLLATPSATTPARVKPAALPKGFKVRITGAKAKTSFTVAIVIGSKTLYTAKGKSSVFGRSTLTIKPSKSAVARLRGKTTMKLRITLTGADGRGTKIVRTVKLR